MKKLTVKEAHEYKYGHTEQKKDKKGRNICYSVQKYIQPIKCPPKINMIGINKKLYDDNPRLTIEEILKKIGYTKKLYKYQMEYIKSMKYYSNIDEQERLRGELSLDRSKYIPPLKKRYTEYPTKENYKKLEKAIKEYDKKEKQYEKQYIESVKELNEGNIKRIQEYLKENEKKK